LLHVSDAGLFFYRSRHHRVLHSFPTRRSSDLMISRTFAAMSRPASSLMPIAVRSRPEQKASPAPVMTTTRLASRADSRMASAKRSEEHTSELQSPYDLVCRLLLEKKIKMKSNG